MTLLGREAPDLSCTVFFDEWEVKVLETLHTKKTTEKPERPLTIAAAILIIAQLGGFFARPSDPPPGTQRMWRGLIRFYGMVDGFRLAHDRPP